MILFGRIKRVKHNTFITDYIDGGLKDIDIRAKMESLHLSWLKRLYDGNKHPWKKLPLALLKEQFTHEIFYPNVQVKLNEKFPEFIIKSQKVGLAFNKIL